MAWTTPPKNIASAFLSCELKDLPPKRRRRECRGGRLQKFGLWSRTLPENPKTNRRSPLIALQLECEGHVSLFGYPVRFGRVVPSKTNLLTYFIPQSGSLQWLVALVPQHFANGVRELSSCGCAEAWVRSWVTASGDRSHSRSNDLQIKVDPAAVHLIAAAKLCSEGQVA